MVNIKKFPRGIEVVAKSGKSHANLELDQVISSEVRDGARERASWSGPKASSAKLKASSAKLR